MSNKRYTEEFKIEAVKQVVERGRSVREVSQALDVGKFSLYEWVKRYGRADPKREAQDAQEAEIRRLQTELRRVTEERDILKKAAAYFAKVSG
jgi:transposase